MQTTRRLAERVIRPGDSDFVGPMRPVLEPATLLEHNTQIGVRNGKTGTIAGAHNEDAFMESVEMLGVKVNYKVTD